MLQRYLVVAAAWLEMLTAKIGMFLNQLFNRTAGKVKNEPESGINQTARSKLARDPRITKGGRRQETLEEMGTLS